jgi:hypothetical protein
MTPQVENSTTDCIWLVTIKMWSSTKNIVKNYIQTLCIRYIYMKNKWILCLALNSTLQIAP